MADRLLPFVLLALCSAGWAESLESYEATVEKVVRGDALKIATSDGSRLVALYGVVTDEVLWSGEPEPKRFAESLLRKSPIVRVQPVKRLSGLDYVEIILPSGQILNELLLLEGVLRWDKVTAAADARYKELESSARASGVGHWKQAESGQHATNPVAPPSPAAVDSLARIEEFNWKKQLRQVAEFDAQYRIWRSLPENTRELIKLYHLRMLLTKQIETSQLVRDRQRGVERAEQMLAENYRRIADRQNAIAAQNAAEAANLGRVYDDFDLWWNSEMMSGFVQDYQAEAATGQWYSARISKTLANEYAYKTAMDLDRVNQEAAYVSAQHEAARNRHRSAINYLNSEGNAIRSVGRRAEGMELAANQIAAGHDRRIGGSLARMEILDLALSEEYEPQTTLVPLARQELSDGAAMSFRTAADLCQIHWYVTNFSQGAKFRFTVYFEDGAAQHISTRRAPHEAFALIDGGGQIRVVPNLSDGVKIVFEVFDVSQE